MQVPGVRNFSARYLLLIYFGWWIIWMVLQTLVLFNADLLTLDTAIKDATITTVVLAFAGYIMITSMRFYHPRQILQLTWSIGLAIACVFLIRWIATQWLQGEEGYLEFLEKTLVVRGLFSWLMISIITIVAWVWFYIGEQQEIESRKATTAATTETKPSIGPRGLR